jgi:branched-subunit amino acid transport protein
MEVWLAIVGSGMATFATRALPLVADLPIPERGRARRYLDDLPTSIIAALAGAAILAPEQRLALGPEIPAAVVVIAVARWRRNLLVAVLAGVATVAVLRAIA